MNYLLGGLFGYPEEPKQSSEIIFDPLDTVSPLEALQAVAHTIQDILVVLPGDFPFRELDVSLDLKHHTFCRCTVGGKCAQSREGTRAIEFRSGAGQMHQSIEDKIRGLVLPLVLGVHDLMGDEETYGVSTLSVDLFLWVDTTVDEALHYSIDIIDEMLMVQHDVVSKGPEGNDLVDLTL